MPALLALTDHRSNNLFERAARRWVEPVPTDGELTLLRAALETPPEWNVTAGIGAKTLAQLLELRGLGYARSAVLRWAERLP